MAKKKYPDGLYQNTKGVTHADIYFFVKHKKTELNPFDKETIKESCCIILAKAREISPNYKMFISASTKATGLSKATIDNYVATGKALGY